MAREQDTILVVEDDPTIARLLEIHLGKTGYNVLLATRGQEALTICRTTPPDLIVLDVRLPDISGYEVGMALRSAPDTQNIPIVVLTAFGERANRLNAHNLVRADYFLGKPFDIEELSSVIRNQLSSGRRRGQFHPVTNLPTGELVNTQLRELLTSSGWIMALIRINGFEHFTQHYGVVVGEDVLKFTALLLCDIVEQRGDHDDFVGQLVVGPYFVIISMPDRIQAITSEMTRRFTADVKLYYDYQDLQLGRAPAMNLLVATVSDQDGTFADIRELTAAAEARLA
ncbi:MAG: response regulator [Candidatus Viridilinea halotolerans]|uniref:Response regulator n=1 Tax=Candidatus Viridilinea halotolerans TaxID=2491704 RepID=A0A426TUL9_9CHLR|nr:MAG: response regulator [Candidatus Viridilinea halotolerans]